MLIDLGRHTLQHLDIGLNSDSMSSDYDYSDEEDAFYDDDDDMLSAGDDGAYPSLFVVVAYSITDRFSIQ